MNSLYKQSNVAKAYLKYRPVYSNDVAQTIMTYLQRHNGNNSLSSTYDLMVDVGCGSGQATNIFPSYFKKIVGVDASENQIKCATEQNKFDHIQYVVGKAEELPLTEKSVDLLVCGEAVHWFDLSKFLREVSRVLKPKGCMAIFGYWIQSITRTINHSELFDDDASFHLTINLLENMGRIAIPDSDVHDKIFYELIGGYKSTFEQISFPSKERRDHISIKNTIKFADLCGFVCSLMDLEELEAKRVQLDKIFGDVKEANVEKFDLFQAITKKMMKIWNDENETEEFEINFNVFILLACAATDG
ncbi:putative methyltransferase DDB_G0268948 [Clavelina lepadiformis]|uniref:Methyltransferase type 11 domain-containing protein n=1 Tax=Clavelina lepadiformis TaxID=159417 RepID=A0ABP0GSV6_CLALP